MDGELRGSIVAASDFVLKQVVKAGIEAASGETVLAVAEKCLAEVAETAGIRELAPKAFGGLGETCLSTGEATWKGGLNNAEIMGMARTAWCEVRSWNGVRIAEHEAEAAAESALGMFPSPRGPAFVIPLGLSNGLDSLPAEIGHFFNGHGIAKGTVPDQIRALDYMLTKGLDPKHAFYEMPLVGAEEVGSAFGAMRPFDAGAFIILSKPGSTITSGGIESVLVNQHLEFAIPKLAEVYPKVQFIPSHRITEELSQILKAKMPHEYEAALEAATKRIAEEKIAFAEQAKKDAVEGVKELAAGKEQMESWSKFLSKTSMDDVPPVW